MLPQRWSLAADVTGIGVNLLATKETMTIAAWLMVLFAR
jgi:hypothetical protein